MGTKSQQLLTIAATELSDELKAQGWKQKERLSAGIVALHGSGPQSRLKCKEIAYSKEEPETEERMVPLTVLRIERKKKQVYQQLLKTVADSPDLPQSLKMKIDQDLKEAMKQLLQQTRKIREDTHETGD